ncbi:MAG: hypothetical protein L3J93_00510 [Thermoplasmata archaeon]|nr:hypothetical protein [Thermoplasmata archaeon]
MGNLEGTERWLTEVGALRQELAEMRQEQRELARAVQELAQTFKSLAMHLGIASEPYKKAGAEPKEREIPGFG